MFRSEFFVRTAQELAYYFFCRAKREFFFQNLTIGYMTKTLNQIIFFFLHQNQNIFFSNIGNQNIFLEKNHKPPFKLNGCSLIQGEVLSPILFSLYVNDCEMAFINSTCSSIPLELKDLNLFLLIYADDVVIFSESISGLQNMLDTLYEYTKMYV